MSETRVAEKISQLAKGWGSFGVGARSFHDELVLGQPLGPRGGRELLRHGDGAWKFGGEESQQDYCTC